MAIEQYNRLFSRLSNIIEDLNKQSQIIDKQNSEQHQNNAHLRSKPYPVHLFSEHLFRVRSPKFASYVNEVSQRFDELKKHVTLNNNQIIDSLITLLEQQISSIRNAIHSNEVIHTNIDKIVKEKGVENSKQVNQAKESLPSLNSLYQKLSKHHDFERRLIVMFNERKSISSTFDIDSQEYQKSQSEVIAIQHRLVRCQNAISVIEKELRVIQQHYNATL